MIITDLTYLILQHGIDVSARSAIEPLVGGVQHLVCGGYFFDSSKLWIDYIEDIDVLRYVASKHNSLLTRTTTALVKLLTRLHLRIRYIKHISATPHHTGIIGKLSHCC